MKWFKALTFDQKAQLARDFGLAMFQAGLYAGLGVVFSGIFLEWKWIGFAVGLSVAADLAMGGIVLLFWGCRKNPDAAAPPTPRE